MHSIYNSLRSFYGCLFTAGLLCLLLATEVHAQSSSWAYPSRNLFIGELQNFYVSGGAKMHYGSGEGWAYPGWDSYTESFVGGALYLTMRDFEKADGSSENRRVSQVGIRFNGVGEMFGQELKLEYRFEPPKVIVDGNETSKWAIKVDEVNPNLDADAKISNVVWSHSGIELERTIRAYSNEYHDNYHIVEYVLTNKSGDIDPDGKTVPQQTIKDLHMTNVDMHVVNQQSTAFLGWGAGWGEYTEGDALTDADPHPWEPDRAQYMWTGLDVSVEWNNLGAPVMSDDHVYVPEGDSVGRLTADHFVGFGTLHADTGPDDNTDDIGQPSGTHYNVWEVANAPADKSVDILFDRISRGRQTSQFDSQVPPEPGKTWKDRMATQSVPAGPEGPWGHIMRSYGPYTLEPGEKVRIVQAKAAAGLSDKAALEIGKQYKTNWKQGVGDASIDFDANGNGVIDEDESMSKNYWVATSRDSLFQTLGRARNAYRNGYEIPRPPQPPARFEVNSEPGRIDLEWDPPTGGPTHVGYEVWRTPRRVEGEYTKIAGVDELDATSTSYRDEDVQRGISYYYYIQTVGEVNTDTTASTPSGVRLKSNRAYTQTYDPAIKKRAPGGTLEQVRIVPNPYNLKSESEVRWPDRQDQLAFFDIPGECTIKIYTESGELIETIEHMDGSGDELWNLTTSSNQLVVSGIYIAVVEDHDTNDTVVRKFVVIR